MGARDAQRHFGGWYTRLLVGSVRARLGDAGVAAVLEAAGETRPMRVLVDQATWSSYEQLRALLRASVDALGGLDEVSLAGARVNDLSEMDIDDTIQTLETPHALYENLGIFATTVSPILATEAVGVDATTWRVHQRFVDGFAPFAELCAFSRGTLQLPAKIFGNVDVSVVEEQCVLRGGTACTFLVRWTTLAAVELHERRAQLRIGALEQRLEEFQQAVGDLISGADLDTVLTRTFFAASRAVRAPSAMLVLDSPPPGVRRIYSAGIEAADLEATASVLLAAPSDDTVGRVLADVVSPRQWYGRLAAIRPATTGMVPHELRRLQAYAGFIAAALDSAWAVQEARRQGESARALLQLSTALAEITSVQDMAAKLVRAVAEVMGCDRATVLLPDDTGTHARIAATYGFAPEFDAVLRTRQLPIVDRALAQPEYHQRVAASGNLADVSMAESGSVANVVIPIAVDGQWAGEIVASVVDSPERLQPTEQNEERLRGLAAQAATAIRNARLLDQIRHQALHDPLTGLPNRALILDRVEQLLARARRRGGPPAAMFIDLDGFKEINDTFGHAVGDELLRAVTARVRGVVRPSDTVGRLGGDEFVVLLDGVSCDANPELVAERILEVVRPPFEFGEQVGPLSVTASIGIATGDRHSPGDLLRDADIALYEAKAHGKNRYRVFEANMQASVQDRLLLQMDLHAALAEEQYFLLYQPICDLPSGRVTGVEALLRWQHPTRGEVQPDEFIPLLEESGLIVDVGRWVLREACRRGAALHARGHAVDIAVNVSGRQLQTAGFVADVDEALRESDLDPRSLVVEITESVMMTDVQAIGRQLQAVRERGVRVAVDDFGTGYSSLAVLREFPVDQLKIDRAFVSELGDSSAAAALMHTLVQLGKTLGLATLAEGIEEPGQYSHLQQEQCESGQGFLIARPLSSGDLDAFLDARPSKGSTVPASPATPKSRRSAGCVSA